MDRDIDRFRDILQCLDRVYGKTAESSSAKTSPPRHHSRALHQTADHNRRNRRYRARLSNDRHERVKDNRRRPSSPRRSRKDLSKRVTTARVRSCFPDDAWPRVWPISKSSIYRVCRSPGLCHKWLRPAAGENTWSYARRVRARKSKQKKCLLFVHSEILSARRVPTCRSREGRGREKKKTTTHTQRAFIALMDKLDNVILPHEEPCTLLTAWLADEPVVHLIPSQDRSFDASKQTRKWAKRVGERDNLSRAPSIKTRGIRCVAVRDRAEFLLFIILSLSFSFSLKFDRRSSGRRDKHWSLASTKFFDVTSTQDVFLRSYSDTVFVLQWRNTSRMKRSRDECTRTLVLIQWALHKDWFSVFQYTDCRAPSVISQELTRPRWRLRPRASRRRLFRNSFAHDARNAKVRI